MKTKKRFFYPIYDIICVVQLKKRGSIRGSHEGLKVVTNEKGEAVGEVVTIIC